MGKIPVGALSLRLFTEVQEPRIMRRLEKLEATATEAWERRLPTFEQDLTDLHIYRAQLKRVLAVSLYFLEIRAENACSYKIGVTSRPVDERVREIQQALRPQFPTVRVSVLGAWPHRGNVELYFKHRYHVHQQRIGVFTEYYQFADVAPVLRDLRRLPPKELSTVEHAILHDVPSALDQGLAEAATCRAAEEAAARRSTAIQQGMQRAAAQGVHVGRPQGSAERLDDFLAKPVIQRVMAALDQGLSIRKAAQAAGASVNTVRKVVALRTTPERGRA
jgi:hypothetical protein